VASHETEAILRSQTLVEVNSSFLRPIEVNTRCTLISLAAALACSVTAFSSDQPQWGQAWSRNMVSEERGLPVDFDPKSGRNVKWVAALGTETHSTPVIAGGRIFIGTNNDEPRDPKHQGDRGVLMCFAEKDGSFLWQLVVPKREEDPFFDWPKTGISSPVTVEGERVYLVSNRGEVLCLDARGMANGNDGPYVDEGKHMAPAGEPATQPGPRDADILWRFDLVSDAGIWSHDAAHSSVLIQNNYLYLNTGTGVDNTHKKIRTPEAPSLVVIDKTTGRFVARDREQIAPRIFHCTWSAPSLASINGNPLLIFAGGDGVIYAFDTIRESESKTVQTLEKKWWFDFDPAAPKENVHRYNSNRRESPSNIYGMPVVHSNKVYVAGGGDLFWGKNEAWLKCIDATQRGDVTQKAQLWSYPLEKHVLGTPAIYEGMVFIADCGRKMHCVDASTGKPYWTHDIEGEVWASPYVADGKVYLGARQGDFWVFKAARQKEVLARIRCSAPISATAVAANGVLYVATMTQLYAIEQRSTANGRQ
jgi:outer membrane protein assembly factor BamB